MNRLLYENSLSYKGFLIIPFILGKLNSCDIYSYKLLAEIGYKSRFHKTDNPASIYGNSVEKIIEIAREHLDEQSEFFSQRDIFKHRYTYHHNLIIVSQESGKYFYNHYPPDSLNNIAAPKLFQSEHECVSWIRQGMDGLNMG